MRYCLLTGTFLKANDRAATLFRLLHCEHFDIAWTDV